MPRDANKPPGANQSRAAARLVLLLQQLENEWGKTRATRARIARVTELNPSSVSNLLNDVRNNVKGETIDKVQRKFRSDDGRVLHRDFFYRDLPTTPNYRDYLVTPGRSLAGPIAPSPPPSTPPPTQDQGDEDYTEQDLIDELHPLDREIKVWNRLIKRFRYPSTAPWVKRLVIQAVRENRKLEKAMDEALDKMGDNIARDEDDDGKKR